MVDGTDDVGIRTSLHVKIKAEGENFRKAFLGSSISTYNVFLGHLGKVL